MVGYHPEVILAGRRINDGMGQFIAEQTVKMPARQGLHTAGQTVIVLGLTFKEDVPDLRNSKVIDVVRELEAYGINVLIHDPIADKEEAHEEYGVNLVDWDKLPKANAIVAAVKICIFLNLPLIDAGRKRPKKRNRTSIITHPKAIPTRGERIRESIIFPIP